MKKIVLAIACIALTAVSCNPFSTPISAGLIKTVNGGADWQAINTLVNPPKSSMAGLPISTVAFEPGHRNVLFAGSYDGGLYKSDDSGDNWSRILSKINVYDIAINPQNTKIIYAAGSYADHGKLLVTTDGGVSWQEIYNEESTNNPVWAVAVNPNQPNQLVIGMYEGNALKSADGGQTWSLLKKFDHRVQRIRWQQGTISFLVRSEGIYRTSDFGLTLNRILVADSLAPALNNGYLSNSSFSGGDAFNQFYLDPINSQLMYVTSNEGLYKTVDGGSTWHFLQLPINSTKLGARSIAVAPTSSNIVMASIGATIYKSVDGGSTWQTQGIATNGIINYILIDPELPQIVYAGIDVK